MQRVFGYFTGESGHFGSLLSVVHNNPLNLTGWYGAFCSVLWGVSSVL